MFEENQKKSYVGSELNDGSVRIEGPLSRQEADLREKVSRGHEGLPASQTKAGNKGEAILKILTGVINRQKFLKK